MNPSTPTGLVFITLFLLAICFPKEAYLVSLKIGIELELMWLNFRMRRMQLKLYRQLQRDHKERGWPELPPFKYTRIQDRD